MGRWSSIAAHEQSGKNGKKIIGAAYAYAAGSGPMPDELKLAQRIDRWGAYGVLGGPMSVNEIARIETVESIINIYRSREKSESWATWAMTNEPQNGILLLAMKYAIDLGLIENGE